MVLTLDPATSHQVPQLISLVLRAVKDRNSVSLFDHDVGHPHSHQDLSYPSAGGGEDEKQIISTTLEAWVSDGRFRVVVARGSRDDGEGEGSSVMLGFAAWKVEGYEESAVDYLDERDEEEREVQGSATSTPIDTTWSEYVQAKALKAMREGPATYISSRNWQKPWGDGMEHEPLRTRSEGSDDVDAADEIRPPARYERLAAFVLIPGLTNVQSVGIRLIRWGTRGADLRQWECWTRLRRAGGVGEDETGVVKLLRTCGFEILYSADRDEETEMTHFWMRRPPRG